MAEVIEGVALNDLVAGVEQELRQGKEQEVRKVIHSIFGDISRWDREIETKQREIASLQGKRAGAVEKIAKLRAGDWGALPRLQGGQNDKQAAEA